MVQDIFPSVLYNQYKKDAQPSANSRLMFIRGDEVLHKIEGEKLIYPTYGECNTDGVDVRYLFSVDETQYFLAFSDT